MSEQQLQDVTAPKRTMLTRVRRVCRMLGPYARPHRSCLALGLAAALVVVACRLAFPWPLRGILESVFPNGGDHYGPLALVPGWANPVLWLGTAFVLIVLGQGLAEYFQRVAFARFAIRMVHDTREAAVASLFEPRRVAKRARSPRNPGDLIAQVVGDSARVKAGLKGVLIHVAQNGVLFTGVWVVLLLTSRELGLIFLVGGIVAAVMAAIGAVRVSRMARRHRRKEGDFAGKVHRALVEADESTRFTRTNNTSAQADAEISRVEGLTTLATHVVLALTACAIMIVGVRRVQAGDLPVGDLFTFLAYILTVHNPTVRLGRQVARLGPILASAERLAGVFEGRGTSLRAVPKLVPLSHELELRDVPLQKRINLVIRHGEKVAIIGPRGSGKTSLLELIGGLRGPRTGAVAWAGVDLASIQPRSRAEQVAYLPQAPGWPRLQSPIRRAAARDLFYNPGRATQAALAWLGRELGIGHESAGRARAKTITATR